MPTVTVEFPDVDRRNNVHDALGGYAETMTEDTPELRCLFRCAQAIGEVENNEPATMANHPMFSEPSEGAEVRHPLLEVTIEFRDLDQQERCREFLAATRDADLQWLADQF